MSQADIETLRAEYHAIGRRDFFRSIRPDFELKTPDQGPDAGTTLHGADEARKAFEEFFGPYEEVMIEPQEFFERGDQIVVFFVMRSRPKGSSALIEIRAAHLWTMRDGRAARLEIFPRREDALEAAGLSGRRWTGPER
jgi:ketosteroid isomerase-like protein